MKNRVAQIAQGTVSFPKPEVRFSVDKLNGTVLPDKTMTVSVDVVSENRVPMQLFFYSMNPRVHVSKNLTVATAGKLAIEIDSHCLTPGDEIRGTIDIVYNGGEAAIPYRFTVGIAGGGETHGFQSLEAFAAFAAVEPKEALNVFSWKEFLWMPFMHDLRLQGLYRTYYSNLHTESGLRAFLQAAGQAVPGEKTGDAETLRPERKVQRTAEGAALRLHYRTVQLFNEFLIAQAKNASTAFLTERIGALVIAFSDDPDLSLLYAYALHLNNERDRAKEVLIRIQDRIQKERMEIRDRYCLFLYLAGVLQEDLSRVANTGKLVHKYWQEGTATPLMALLEYKLNNDFEDHPEKAAEFLWQCDAKGLGGTVLMTLLATLWEEKNIAPERLGRLELQTLLYGVRKGVISERKLFEAFSNQLTDPTLLNPYICALKAGYQRFGNIELLLALMNVYLQKKYAGKQYFHWYEEAVRRQMTIRGLYEYYMASLPQEFDEALPLSLVRYFGYQKENSSSVQPRLYANVLTYYADDPDIMELYRDKMDRFALRAMADGVYSCRLKPLFRQILNREHLSQETAPGMLQLFYLQEITTSLPHVRRVILYYPQLDKEDSYVTEEGGKKVLAPVFSEEAILAVETEKGERLYDPGLSRTPVFDDPELKKQCALYAGDSLLYKLAEADGILRNGMLREADLFLVTGLIGDERIAPFYRTKLYEAMIDLSLSPGMRHIDCTEFLIEADYTGFTREYKTKLLSALIGRERFQVALDRVLSYDAADLTDDDLVKLLEAAADYPVMDGNDSILAYSYLLYEHDSASAKVLEFLAKHFNGRMEDMSGILRVIRKKKVPPHDLAERAMTVAFFTEKTRDLDSLFDGYLPESKKSDPLVRAYLVLRSHENYMKKRRLTENAVKTLKELVFTLPRICYLALSTYCAEHLSEANADDRALMAKMARIGIEANVVNPVMTKYKDAIELPFEFENRVYAEYRNDDAREVAVLGTVFPGNHVFHRLMSELYPGVFKQSFILYRGEWIQYSFLVYGKDGSVTEEDGGILSGDQGLSKRGTRYHELCNLEKKIGEADKMETAECLKTLLLKEELVDGIFGPGTP